LFSRHDVSSRHGAFILINIGFIMQTSDEQLLLSILNQAQEGKAIEFQFIRFWTDYRYYRRTAWSTKIIIRALKSGAKKLFKTYCKDIAKGTADLNMLFAYKQLSNVIAFYERDLNTLKRMIDEYDEYLGQGHFWHSFLGGERTLPWNIT
jgi:hypothetical protein